MEAGSARERADDRSLIEQSIDSVQGDGKAEAKPSKQAKGEAAAGEGKASKRHLTLEDLGPEGLLTEEQALALASRVLGREYADTKSAVDALNGLLGGGRGRSEAEISRVREAATGTISRWKATVESLQAQLAEARKGAGAPKGKAEGEGGSIPADRAPGGAGGAASAKFLETLGPQGWAYYQSLYEEKGPQWAAAWLADKQEAYHQASLERLLEERDRRLREEIRGEFDPRLKPVEEVFEGTRVQQEQQAAALDLFGQVYEGAMEDGVSAFPELGDADAVAEIVQVWMKGDPRTRFTPMAVENAVYRFRAANPGWKARVGGEVAVDSGSTASAEVGGGVERTGGRGAQRGSGVISGSGVPGHGLPAGKPRGAADELDADMRRLTAMRKEFGFVPTNPNGSLVGRRGA